MFYQKFVKPGLIRRELGQLYDRLFDKRQKGDYADLFRFDVNEVGRWYDEVKIFVESVSMTAKEHREKTEDAIQRRFIMVSSIEHPSRNRLSKLNSKELNAQKFCF